MKEATLSDSPCLPLTMTSKSFGEKGPKGRIFLWLENSQKSFDATDQFCGCGESNLFSAARSFELWEAGFSFLFGVAMLAKTLKELHERLILSFMPKQAHKLYINMKLIVHKI